MDEEEYLAHYGVQGMKWGIRRATYRARSADGLRRSKKNVENDLLKLEKKKLKADKKSAKLMSKGKIEKAGKYMKKSYKRDKTIFHNKKLLKLYDKRISELESKPIEKGESLVKESFNRKLANFYSGKETYYKNLDPKYKKYLSKTPMNEVTKKPFNDKNVAKRLDEYDYKRYVDI